MQDAPSRQDLLRHRLNAACNSSQRLTVLTTSLAMSIDSIQQELMDVHGWSDEDAALAIVDALRYVENGLLEALVQ